MILWSRDVLVPVVIGGTYPDWCERCQTSSAVRTRLYVLGVDGPLPVGLWWACRECDPDRFEHDDGDQGDVDPGDGGVLV